jgi:hypothetical protein
MAVTTAIAAVVGTAVSIDAANKSAAAQKERNKVTNATQKAEDARNIRQQAREERIRRAEILQASESTGASGSSAEAGAVASLGVQVAENKARVSGQQLAAQGIGQSNQAIADAQVQSQLGQSITSISSQAFSEAGGFDTLFKGG